MREPGWFFADECKIDDLRRVVAVETQLADYPHAAAIEHNVVIFDTPRVRQSMLNPDNVVR